MKKISREERVELEVVDSGSASKTVDSCSSCREECKY